MDEATKIVYRFGRFRLFPQLRLLLDGDAPTRMRPHDMAVLSFLVEHRDRAVSKDEILDAVWADDSFVEPNNVEVRISALRKLLGRATIATIPGRGYQFVAALQRPDGAPPDVERVEAEPRPDLPQRVTGLIGRDVERAEVLDLIRRHRLVTLTGPGGIGKTRLALDVGQQAGAFFPDGVRLIDLAPVATPSLVPVTVATALGASVDNAELAVDAIAAKVGRRRMLLIFDTCDYMVGTAAKLIPALLEQAPGLSVLVTSQEIFDIPAEVVYRLEPLATPPGEPAADFASGPGAADRVARFGAVELFVERARAADRRFRLDDDNAAAVAEICRRLDGIPLVLEMAAPWLPLLGLEGLRSRLDKRLDMMKIGQHTAETRHQTLRLTLEWSSGLLAPADQRIFRCLGVFAGSFALEAAIAVAGNGGDDDADPADPLAVMEAFGRLVDKSLLTVEGGEEPRYRLIETQRLFAAEQLAASGERDAIAERHVRFYIAQFERAFEAWETTADAVWLGLYRPDLDNVRAALDWTLAAPARATMAVALAGAAARLWEKLGLIAEIRRYLDRVVDLVDAETLPAAAARVLRYAGVFWRTSDRLRALTLLERSAALYRQYGEKLDLAPVLGAIGWVQASLGHYGEARASLAEAIEILAASDRRKSLCNAVNNLGSLSLLTNDIAEARICFTRALDLARALKDPVWEYNIQANLAEADFAGGDVDRAVERAREAADWLRNADRRSYLEWILLNLAAFLTARGDLAEARDVAEEALSLACREGGYVVRVAVQVWALLAALDGKIHEAVQLIGFVDAAVAASGETRQPVEQQGHDRLMQLLEAALPKAHRSQAAAEGAGWSEAQAVEFVREAVIAKPRIGVGRPEP